MKDYVRDSVCSKKGFWIGDPAWVLDEVPELIDGITSVKGIPLISAKTNELGTFQWAGRRYDIKSGRLALIPLELCNPALLEQNADRGKIWNKAGEATLYSHFGYFEVILPGTSAIVEVYTGKF